MTAWYMAEQICENRGKMERAGEIGSMMSTENRNSESMAEAESMDREKIWR